jgi:hypothetical protein
VAEWEVRKALAGQVKHHFLLVSIFISYVQECILRYLSKFVNEYLYLYVLCVNGFLYTILLDLKVFKSHIGHRPSKFGFISKIWTKRFHKIDPRAEKMWTRSGN